MKIRFLFVLFFMTNIKLALNCSNKNKVTPKTFKKENNTSQSNKIIAERKSADCNLNTKKTNSDFSQENKQQIINSLKARGYKKSYIGAEKPIRKNNILNSLKNCCACFKKKSTKIQNSN